MRQKVSARRDVHESLNSEIKNPLLNAVSTIASQTLADAWAERATDPWTQKALRPNAEDAAGRPMEAAAEPVLHAHSSQRFDLEKLLPLSVAVLQSAAGDRGPDTAEEVHPVTLCRAKVSASVYLSWFDGGAVLGHIL